MKARLDKGARVAEQMRKAGFVRQPIPVIPIAYASPIQEAYEQHERSECYGNGWSVAQHCKVS